MHSQTWQITWAERHFWKPHFEDDAVGSASGPLHGTITEAEDFNRLEAAPPVITTRMGIYFIFVKEGKERAHISASKHQLQRIQCIVLTPFQHPW